MYNVKVDIKLLSFEELTEEAKRVAIEDHRNFELGIMQPDDYISGDPEYDTEEELQKIYDREYNYYLMNDEPIIENIEANNYLFFEDGTLAHCTTHIQGNKVVKTVFHFNNMEYLIE